jgi:hypothetical protein
MENSDLDAEAIARRSMALAASICVYTNGNLTVDPLEKEPGVGDPAHRRTMSLKCARPTVIER